MSSVCVYTVLIGDDEELADQPVAKSSGLPFICLTDNRDLQSGTWEIRAVEPLFALDPIRSQRAIKIRPHEYLPDFARSLYVDNSVLLQVEPERIVDCCSGASGFSLPKHRYRETVLDEFLEVERLGLDDEARLFEQLNHYLLDAPEVLQEQALWTGIMLRDHENAHVRAMLDIWSAHVQRYSRRDQLSINYAFRRAGLQPETLEVDNNKSWFDMRPRRTGSNRTRALRVANSFFSSPVARLKLLEQENKAYRAEKKGLERLVADLKRIIAQDPANADLQRLLAEQKLQNEALLTSTSWRVTAPMRGAITWLRASRPALRRALHRLVSAGKDRKGPLPAVHVGDCSDVDWKTRGTGAAVFAEEGFIGPLDLFTQAQCALILKHYRFGARPVSPEWPKDRAVRDRVFYDLACRPALLQLLRTLLGEDIMLWGASVIERDPGQTHIWHVDIESSAPDARCVSVWIGLENTRRDSALQLMSRSHRFGKPIQQEVHERGFRRGQASDRQILSWAREYDERATLVQPEMHDGQALIFDGRLWHASHNGSTQRRTALLLQYAASEKPIIIPAFQHVEWPLRFTSQVAPSVVVSGKTSTVGTLPPPAACGAQALGTHVHAGEGFNESPDGWIPYPLFHGPTPVAEAMESHVSVLSPGRWAHPPHCHIEEELLIVLRGEAEILIANGVDPVGARAERLRPGAFVYYPAYQFHTIRNVSQSPVTYLMFKWQGEPIEVERPLQTTIFAMGDTATTPSAVPMAMRTLFEASTGFLRKLHAHVTELEPGAGYPEHVDEHDVAIVLFSGVVETLAQRVGPGGSIYYAAGEPHGLRNIGSERARYLVFEFHANG
jgi:uncharacterized cupin superfamily protein